MLVALRAAYAVAVTVLVVVFLSHGWIFGAVALVALGVWARRAADDGRLARLARRLTP